MKTSVNQVRTRRAKLLFAFAALQNRLYGRYRQLSNSRSLSPSHAVSVKVIFNGANLIPKPLNVEVGVRNQTPSTSRVYPRRLLVSSDNVVILCLLDYAALNSD